MTPRKRERTSQGVSADLRDRRSRSRVTNDGVWDDDCRYWELAGPPLSLDEVASVLGTMPVGIQDGYGRAPEFGSADRGKECWARRVSTALANSGDFKDSPWPDRVTYEALVLVRADGSRLLWFGGRC